MTANIHRHFLILLTLTLSLSGALSACSIKPASDDFPMASMNHMPVEVQSAPVTVQQSYQFAVANPDVMHELPCYCGCGPIGHTSNYSCYVAEQNLDGSVKTFDNHALGCSICVDITQDAMRLLREGKTVPDIRTYADQTYSKYGLSNMP